MSTAVSLNTASPEEKELADLIIATLNLDLDTEKLDGETPIYGEGFGLDSIDILEIALAISQRYGVSLQADNRDNLKIFKNLASLNAYIQLHKPK